MKNTLKCYVLLAGCTACSFEPDQQYSSQPLEFTINGKHLVSHAVGTPDPLDEEDVYQTELYDVLSFSDRDKDGSYGRTWTIGDDDPVSLKSHSYSRAFSEPGLFRVRLCKDNTNVCLTKYVHVARPDGQQDLGNVRIAYSDDIQEQNERQAKETIVEVPNTTGGEHGQPGTQRSKLPETERGEPMAPAGYQESSKPAQVQASTVVPERRSEAVFRVPGAAGLPRSLIRPDCTGWVKSGKIVIRPRKDLRLEGASVYADAAGRIMLTLIKQDDSTQESKGVVVMKGKDGGPESPFTFEDLDPELQAGRTYELLIESKGPQIANIHSCSPRFAPSPDIEIVYSDDFILFDLKYIKE